jgi:hypothetical protein
MATNKPPQPSSMAISSRLHKAIIIPHHNSSHHRNNHNTADLTCRP